ncbi:hypothetical protein ACIBF1_19670 [Spirillospora sp. NPDC050679]
MAVVLAGSPASGAGTSIVERSSANDCAWAQINYTVTPEAGGTFRVKITGTMVWQEDDPVCKGFRRPYAGVLQWKGTRNGNAFGWSAAPGGWMSANPHTIPLYSGSGYKDVQFRACNWNTGTGYVGTCG